MADETRDALAVMLDQLLGDPERDTATREFLARETANAILATFVVVPRSDIVGTEYGWRRSEGDVEVNGPDLGELRSYIREVTGQDAGLYFEHLTRRLAVIPLPAEERHE